MLSPAGISPVPPPWQQQPHIAPQGMSHVAGATGASSPYTQYPQQQQQQQQPSYPVGPRNGQKFGYGAQYQFPTEIVPPSGSKMSTKVEIGDLTERDEVDITFMPGPIGMRLDERGGLLPVSVVTNLVPNGQAALAGVEIGCIVMGINGERFVGSCMSKIFFITAGTFSLLTLHA